MPGTTGPPRVALFSLTQVAWSNGTPLSGSYLIGLVPPSDGNNAWTEIDYGQTFPGLSLPVWQRIPIVAGIPNGSSGLYYNSDLTPPGSQYIYYVFDTTMRRIAGPSVNFTISSSPVSLPTLTLPAPSTTGTPPLPDQPFTDGGGTVTLTPYSQALLAATSVSVPQTTHLKGTLPIVFALDDSVPANYVPVAFSVAANGDVTAAFSPAFTGTLVIY